MGPPPTRRWLRVALARRAVALAATVLLGVGVGACATAEQSTRTVTTPERSAPTRADRKAADRAWRSFVRKRAREYKKGWFGRDAGVSVRVGSEPVWLRDCIHWAEEGAFCATGSVTIVSRSTAVKSSRTWIISGKVARADGRWVASDD